MTGATRYVLSGAITVMGAACLVWSVAKPQDEMRSELRHTRGSGWWIGRLMALLPGSAMRVAFALLSVGIIALGVAGLAGA